MAYCMERGVSQDGVDAKTQFANFMDPSIAPCKTLRRPWSGTLELIQWLDILGFDEAYIVGEHHSARAGRPSPPRSCFSPPPPQRTRHIRLGTGVISLPYHHPLMVANRMVLLDHLTRGRVYPRRWPRKL